MFHVEHHAELRNTVRKEVASATFCDRSRSAIPRTIGYRLGAPKLLRYRSVPESRPARAPTCSDTPLHPVIRVAQMISAVPLDPTPLRCCGPETGTSQF